MVTAAARGEVRPVVMQTTTGNMDSATSGIIRRPAGRRPDGGGHGFNRLYETPAGLSPSQRFEHWREWYSQAIENPVRLEPTGPLSARFFPSASSLTGPGFSLIELHNGPAVGSWNANPDLNDLRLTYFAKAPSATYNFGREPVSINAPRVRFLDLTRGGAFRAPAGMHIIQLNLDRTGLELNGAGAMRLAAAENLIQHPVLRSLLMPVLLNCRAAGMEAHVAASGTVLRSAVAALISSLLDVQASPELLEPSAACSEELPPAKLRLRRHERRRHRGTFPRLPARIIYALRRGTPGVRRADPTPAHSAGTGTAPGPGMETPARR